MLHQSALYKKISSCFSFVSLFGVIFEFIIRREKIVIMKFISLMQYSDY